MTLFVAISDDLDLLLVLYYVLFQVLNVRSEIFFLKHKLLYGFLLVIDHLTTLLQTFTYNLALSCDLVHGAYRPFIMILKAEGHYGGSARLMSEGVRT